MSLWRIVAAVALLAAPASAEEATEPPRDVGLVERSERRLIQVDVSVRPKGRRDDGPPEIEAGDLELLVAGRVLPIVHADRVCRPQAAEATAEVAAVGPRPAAVPVGPRTTYVFFFEHRHLTLTGQQHALEMAKALIPELIANGDRGIVVSSGRRLIQSPIATTADELLAAVAEIAKDTGQWTEMTYAQQEHKRYEDISVAPSDRMRLALARMYAREEVQSATNRLGRLAATLGMLADVDPPKIVLYFSDTIRMGAGNHYLDFVGEPNPGLAAEPAFDRLVETAGAFGVRLYTVMARGIYVRGMRSTDPRAYDAADSTLVALALETGGARFRGGVDSGSITAVLDRLRSDLDCFWLLSADPEGLPVDEPLPLRVRFVPESPRAALLDGHYELAARGLITVASPGRRAEGVLLAAHIGTGASDTILARAGFIPLGYSDGAYDALVQFVVPASELQGRYAGPLEWEIGLSRVFEDRVDLQSATRVATTGGAPPVVFETRWRFEPGDHEVVGVAREKHFEQLASARVELAWPDPRREPVSIAPPAVVQTAEALFVAEERGDATEPRNRGTIASADGRLLAGRPTAVIGVVCRGRWSGRSLRIERRLRGEVAFEFPPIDWNATDEDRCVQLRDTIDGASLSSGGFFYDVKVTPGDDPERALAERSVRFDVVDLGEPRR